MCVYGQFIERGGKKKIFCVFSCKRQSWWGEGVGTIELFGWNKWAPRLSCPVCVCILDGNTQGRVFRIKRSIGFLLKKCSQKKKKEIALTSFFLSFSGVSPDTQTYQLLFDYIAYHFASFVFFFLFASSSYFLCVCVSWRDSIPDGPYALRGP